MGGSLLSFLLLALALVPASPIALPNCHSADFLKVLPLVPEEAYIINLNSLFAGYNLRFNASVDPDLQKYVELGEKVRELNSSYPDVPLAGLKSYHLSSVGNSWGPQFIALTERGDKTLVHFGILSDNVSVPVINNYVTVENLANTTCFDAIQIAESNLIVVDCAQKRTANNSRGQLFDNLFYYFRISDGAKLKELRTQMYAPFQEQSRRRLELYHNVLSSHTLLFRTYFTDRLSLPAKDNTYLEILMMQDPLSPWTVGVIDRTFLGVQRLWISDVKVYLGSIYILDQLKGVHRVYLSGYEELEYQGLYEAKGFSRLAVYSPNLDNHLELAISNTHAIHEVDWTTIEQPLLLNKYSILPDSAVSQVFLNDRFVVVRSSALSQGAFLNYTWVFTRGDRTFSRAFATMAHPTDSTLVDFNPELSYLMVVGEELIQNFAYDDPSFVLRLDHNKDLLNRVRSFKIAASSSDPSGSGGTVTCEVVLNFTLLEEDNRTMWEVGGGPPSNFSANYPGLVKIQLGDYILGPNVTYRVREVQKGQLKKAKVFQSEQLSIVWQGESPPLAGSTFLRTQTFEGAPNDTLLIYSQDKSNRTFISRCSPHHEHLEVSCQLNSTRGLGGKITNWATSLVEDPAQQQQKRHLLAFSTQEFFNQIFLEDLGSGQEVEEIYLGNGFPGNLSSVTTTGRYMYVVLRHIKRVDIYSLEECLDENCFPMCSLNHMNMFRLGVRYFAPRTVHSSPFHPDLLFVKTEDSILAVDLSKECVPKLLATVRPVPNASTHFAFEVNANFLIVTIAPNIVQEYDLSRVYLRDVRATKRYPLYGLRLPGDYDFDISDYGNCVYLSGVAEGGDYNVMVYRSGLPAVGSLYNQIDLVSFQNVLIDASGYRVDYVSVVSSQQLRIFRQYERPEVEIVNPDQDYQFYLEYHNWVDSASLQLVDVFIINLPTNISVNPLLNDIMNTKDLFFSGENRLNEVDDSDWYRGNVLFIQAVCRDCPSKVRVNNHIQLENNRSLIPHLTSFAHSPAGGQLLAERTLLSFRHNGSIDHTVSLDPNPKRRCTQVVAEGRVSISGCLQEGKVFLQLVTWTARKPFPMQAQETSATAITRLQITQELVMLVDAGEEVYPKRKRGGIYLFELSQDLDSDEALTEVEYVDGEDFGMRELGAIFINNAELIYDPERDIYFLYASEAKRGLLVLEFSHAFGAPDITIRRTYLVELRPLLEELEETLPYDATFQAIASKGAPRTDNGMTIHRLLVTTARYHSLQLTLTFDEGSSLRSTVIERLFLRYSYYQVSNLIKATDELFLIEQTLPPEYENASMNQQLYTVYSTQGPFNGTVERRGLIGALPLSDNYSHRFDFNRTPATNDQHSVPRTGLVVVEEGGILLEASLHRNLSLFTTELLDTQIIYLDLINDFSTEKIRVLLNGLAPFPEWKLIVIIIFSILGAFLLAGIGFVVFKKVQEGRPPAEERETLVTEENSYE